MGVRRLSPLFALPLLLLVACDDDGRTTPKAECSDDEPCPGDDERCVDGRCVPGETDGGVADTGSTPDNTIPLDSSVDGGQEDSGRADGGSPDQGEPDAGPPDSGSPGCTDDEDCRATEACNPRTHECEPICRLCSPDNVCGAGQHCDDRLGDEGCCIPDCQGDESCPNTQYCSEVTRECEDGCRDEGCAPGSYCDPEDRTCKEGCLEHDDCATGTICRIEERRCVAGCIDDAGCEGEARCDTQEQRCTLGCVADRDCAAGQRCHRAQHLCRRPCRHTGECPEGLTCDGQAGLCTSPAERCDNPLAAACADEPAGLLCNPYTGTCQVPGETLCTSAATCLEDQSCVPQPAAEQDGPAPACLPALGEGGPAAPCTAGDDCASGICQNDGHCFASCRERADCPEDLRCWPVQFYLGAGEDPRDASDDLLQEVLGCRRPPASCSRSADCADPDLVCRPWLDPDDGTLATGCQLGLAGNGEPGSWCEAHADCRTGICTADGLCLAICDEEGGCRDGQRCGSREVTVHGVTGTLPVCVPDPGSGALCTTHGGCLAVGESCRPEIVEEELTFACRPRPGDGLPSTRCAHDWDCESGHCTPRGYCFGLCEETAQCAEGQECTELSLGLADLPDGGLARSCLTLEIPCGHDADCPREGYACIPDVDPLDPLAVELLCRPVVGPDQPGWACTVGDECRTGICLKEPGARIGVCWGACASDEDCDEGLVCDPAGHLFPLAGGGTAPVPACGVGQGSGQACGRSADCSDGEVCTARPNAAQDGLETICRLPVAEEDPLFGCESDDDCRTGVCVPGTGDWPISSCLSLCASDEDCGLVGFMACTEVPLTVAGVEGTVKQCTFAFSF